MPRKAEFVFVGNAESIVAAAKKAALATDGLSKSMQATSDRMKRATSSLDVAWQQTAATAVAADRRIADSAIARAGKIDAASRQEIAALRASGKSWQEVAVAQEQAGRSATITAAAIERASLKEAAASERASRASRFSAFGGAAAGKAKGFAGGLLNVATAGMGGAGVGLGAAVVIGEAAKSAIDFQKSMEMVRTQAGASQAEVDKMSRAVLNLGKSTEQGPKKLADALYEIESVGLRGARALKTLRAASDLAAVGGSDLQTSTSALASTMVAWHIKTDQAGKTAGTLNAIVGAGKMHMQDLVDAMGTKLPGVAHMLGISLTSVGSAIAAFTDQGANAQTAATNLITPLFKMAVVTAPKAKDALKSIGLGVHSLANDLRTGGISKAIDDLHAHLAGKSKNQQTDIVANAFGGSRGSAPILQLLSSYDSAKNSIKARQAQIESGTKKWAADVAAEHKTAAHKIAVAWSSIRSEGIKIGGVILPVIGKIAGGIASLVGFIDKVSSAFSKGKAWAVVIVGVLGAILGIVPGLVVAYEKCKTFRDIVNGAFHAVKDVVVDVFGALKTALTDAVKWVTTAFHDVTRELGSWHAAWAVVGFIADAVKAAFSIIKGVIVSSIDEIVPVVKGGLRIIETVFDAVFPAAKQVVVTTIDVIKRTIQTVVGVITGVVKIIGDILKGKWGKAWDDAVRLVTNAIGGILGILKSAIGGVVSAVGKLASGAVHALVSLPGQFLEIGKNVVQGFINGIKSGIGSVGSAIGGLGKSALGAIKGVLGIGSPSKEFHKIGQWVAEGFVNGLMSAKEAVAAGLNQALVFPIDAAISALDQKKTALQQKWDAIAQAAQRAQLVAAIGAAEHNRSATIVQNQQAAVSGGGRVRGSAAGLSGSQNAVARQLFSVFRAGGLSPAGAAAMIGNWVQESSLNPGEAGGFLAQWGGSRLSSLTSRFGGSPSASQQAQFALSELRGMPGLLHMLQTTGDPQGAALAVSNQYERPLASAANNPHRMDAAAAVFAALSGGRLGRVIKSKAVGGTVVGGTDSSVAQAIQALKDFDTQVAHTKELARIDIKATGLQRIRDYQAAMAGLASTIKDKVSTAVQNFRTQWEATTGKKMQDAQSNVLDSFDQGTQDAIANGPAAQALAAAQSQENAIQLAAEDAAQAKAIADAQHLVDHSGGQTHKDALVQLQAAKDARAETLRQRNLTNLQAQADAERAQLEAQRADQRKQLEAQQTQDYDHAETEATQIFQRQLEQRLNAEQASLQQRAENYAAFVAKVNGILGPLGLSMDSSATDEATVNAGPGTSPITVKIPKHHKHIKHHFAGGSFSAFEPIGVGELGPETVMFDRGGRVAPSGGRGQGGRLIDTVNIHTHKHMSEQKIAAKLAFRLQYG